MENKNAEIEATNKKIVAENEAVQRAFGEGNAALTAATGLAGEAQIQKYDEAVARYDEALGLRPDEAALLTNKSVAIRARGVARYNAAITSRDDAAKAAALADFRAAAELARKAVASSAAPPATPDEAARAAWGKSRYFALAARAEALGLFAGKAEPARAEEAFKAYEELVAVETDPAKRIAERVSAAKMLINAGQNQHAVVVLRKLVADNPANLDANYHLGESLVAAGDKASMKEGAIYLQRFLNAAPPNHPMRGIAKDMLDFIKAQ
jgi:tetratricopeptide (TPR) repeat protein